MLWKYDVSKKVRIFFFNLSGIAQLVEHSTLMPKYPRSIDGEGELKTFNFLLTICLSYINLSANRTWFAFADDPYGWATSKLCQVTRLPMWACQLMNLLLNELQSPIKSMLSLKKFNSWIFSGLSYLPNFYLSQIMSV